MGRDLKYLHTFNSIPGVGQATLLRLKTHFRTLEEAWRAGEQSLKDAGILEPAIQAILWKRSSLNPDKEMEKLIRSRIWILTPEDPLYPPLLKEIPFYPLLIYGKGDATSLSTEALGVVGTRRPTAYGLEVTEQIVFGLAQSHLTIVSGLATGIDTRAHEAAIEGGTKTVAVLGSGIDQGSVFPPENRGLTRRIDEGGGAVISEYAPGILATKAHFPQRNRIISGLSRGVLVVEAREKSGALITARLALEQNRDVFAAPGSIFSPTSRGPHMLIQEGAKLITSSIDVLNELGIEYTQERSRETAEGSLDENEKLILRLLEEPLSLDFVREKTGIQTSVIVSTLALLELKGMVKNLGGDRYQKTMISIKAR